MKKEKKLTSRQTKLLQKRLDEKKALPTRLDQEEPENNKNEDSPVLKEVRSLDTLLDRYIKGYGPSN